MTELRKIDSELYCALYGIPKIGNAQVIWDNIKNNDEILREAIKVEKDKFGERDLVKGLFICRCMLIDYESVNQNLYQELVNTIYSNTDIARLVVDGASNGGYSYLLMTLWNHSLKLTDEQKQFAVSEAMNKSGTTQSKKQKEEFLKKLDDKKITDEMTAVVEFGGCKNPVGAKTAAVLMNSMFTGLSDEQAHGTSPYDIRYEILNNPNWSVEEKKKLVYEFFEDAEEYDEFLDQWKWGIINEYEDSIGQTLDICELYDYTYEYLLNFYENKELTDWIWNEIKFCRTMQLLRPQQWEIEIPVQKRI